MTKPRGRGLALGAFGLLLASSVRCGEGLREDELECERAAIHVRECCPKVSERAFACELVEGCDSSSYPDLTSEDARCLRTTSCADLAGLCAELMVTTKSGGGAAGSTTFSTPSITKRSICKAEK